MIFCQRAYVRQERPARRRGSALRSCLETSAHVCCNGSRPVLRNRSISGRHDLIAQICLFAVLQLLQIELGGRVTCHGDTACMSFKPGFTAECLRAFDFDAGPATVGGRIEHELDRVCIIDLGAQLIAGFLKDLALALRIRIDVLVATIIGADIEPALNIGRKGTIGLALFRLFCRFLSYPFHFSVFAGLALVLLAAAFFFLAIPINGVRSIFDFLRTRLRPIGVMANFSDLFSGIIVVDRRLGWSRNLLVGIALDLQREFELLFFLVIRIHHFFLAVFWPFVPLTSSTLPLLVASVQLYGATSIATSPGGPSAALPRQFSPPRSSVRRYPRRLERNEPGMASRRSRQVSWIIPRLLTLRAPDRL